MDTSAPAATAPEATATENGGAHTDTVASPTTPSKAEIKQQKAEEKEHKAYVKVLEKDAKG